METVYPLDKELLEFINTDDALFHYTKMETATKYIIPTKKIKLSLRVNANDPWEYKFRLLNVSGASLPDDYFEKSLEVQPIIDDILRNRIKVFSFCTNTQPSIMLPNMDIVIDPYALKNGWNKPRMWSQYGENHYGACIVFSKREIIKEMQKLESTGVFCKFGNVLYSQKDRMDFGSITIDGNSLIQLGNIDYADQFVRSNYQEIFFKKHIDYRDESEFRLIIQDKSGNIDLIDTSNAIKGVIWGDKTKQEELSDRHLICLKASIGCRYIYWERGQAHILLCSKRKT